MPFLDLGPDDLVEVPPGRVFSHIGAIMLWPDDPRQRRNFEEAAWANQVTTALRFLDGAQTFVSKTDQMVDILDRLARAPDLNSMKGEAEPRYQKGLIVGVILHDLFGWSELASGKIDGVIKETGTRYGISNRTVYRYWEQLRNVAHFWAAYVIVLETYRKKKCTPPPFPYPLGGFGGHPSIFLAAAETFRLMASKAPHRSAKGPIMSSDAWRTRPEIQLPTVEIKVLGKTSATPLAEVSSF